MAAIALEAPASPEKRARRSYADLLSHLVVIGGIALVAFPLWVAFVASTLTNQEVQQAPMPLLPGAEGLRVWRDTLLEAGQGRVSTPPVWRMMWNSLVMAMLIATGKIAISLLSAYAIVFFRVPGRTFFFWMIFVTLMLPVEVRIVPTLQIVTDVTGPLREAVRGVGLNALLAERFGVELIIPQLNLTNTYAGLIIPLIASATATFMFRQFFLTIPDEMIEAAKIDGAGPLRFFWDMVVPLSRTTMAALFVILFIYGWNQYLWPLLIATQQDMTTIVIGIAKMVDAGGYAVAWNRAMATALLALLPPVIVVIGLQRLFVRGLVDTEK